MVMYLRCCIFLMKIMRGLRVLKQTIPKKNFMSQSQATIKRTYLWPIAVQNEKPTNDVSDADVWDKIQIKRCIFWWQKRNILTIQDNFTEWFSDPSQNLSILQCLTTFFPDTLVDQIAENTNLYTVWRSSKSADTNEIKIKVFIGMHMLMSIDNKIATIFWPLEQHTPKSSYLGYHAM